MYRIQDNAHPALRSRIRMVRVTACAFGFAIAFAPLGGCARDDHTRHEVNRAIDNWQRPVFTARTPTPETREPKGPSTELERGALNDSLPDYVRTALERNPGIKAAAADVRAKLERIPQVQSLPDPMLRMVARPEPIQTAAGDTYFTLGFSQTLPLLAKLERAGDVAAAEARMALEQLNDKRVRLIADVERAYWHLYALERFLDIMRENRRVLNDLVQVVDTQYRVGKVEQHDLLRAQTELGKLRDDEHRLQKRRQSAAAALNRLMDLPSSRAIAVTEPIDVPALQADLDRLTSIAIEHNPQLALLRRQIERDEHKLALADLGYWPDVSLGLEWNYLEGRDAFVPPVNPMTGRFPPINRHSERGTDNWAVTLQMNLPIWTERIDAARREARERLASSRRQLRATENDIGYRIFEAWSRVEAQQHTLRVLDTELIPQARQTYETALISYQSGGAGFLTLIDNWQRWLDFELMRHRETADLATAIADLQREIGMQLLEADSGMNETMGDSPDE